MSNLDITFFKNTLVNDGFGVVRTQLPTDIIGDVCLSYHHIGDGYYMSLDKHRYGGSTGHLEKVDEVEHDTLYYGVLCFKDGSVGMRALTTVKGDKLLVMSNSRELLKSYINECYGVTEGTDDWDKMGAKLEVLSIEVKEPNQSLTFSKLKHSFDGGNELYYAEFQGSPNNRRQVELGLMNGDWQKIY